MRRNLDECQNLETPADGLNGKSVCTRPQLRTIRFPTANCRRLTADCYPTSLISPHRAISLREPFHEWCSEIDQNRDSILLVFQTSSNGCDRAFLNCFGEVAGFCGESPFFQAERPRYQTALSSLDVFGRISRPGLCAFSRARSCFSSP